MFGRVTDAAGLALCVAISKARTTKRDDRPVEPIQVLAVTIRDDPTAA